MITSPPDLVPSPFIGDSEMARRYRQIDWAATPLGPVGQWAPALRTAIRMALGSPFPINLWCGPDLQLIYNDAYITVLGAKHPRAAGQSGRIVWAEIWSEIEPWFRSIAAGGDPVYAEDAHFVMERADGPPDDAWFTFSLSPVCGDDGIVVAYLNIASETTQRIQSDRALRDARAAAERAELRLREVFAQAPAFMAVLQGPNHVFDFANDAYLRLVGRSDILGKPVVEALPEVVDQGFVALLDKVLATGVPFVGRAIPVMLSAGTDGMLEEHFLDFVYQPLTSSTGERIGIVAHGSDVTDSVNAQREIERLWHESEIVRANAQESEARYRFLTNSIPVQVWTATPDGRLDFTSERAAAYFGRAPEDVIGEQWLSVIHPEDVERTVERWRHAVETGTPYEVEFRLWSAAHQAHRWHLGRATPQRDDSGEIIRWFGTNTEIEDRKQSEAELKRLTSEAMEANRAKSDFLAAMSHELRTPLNAIGGYAQLIEMGVRGPITEEQRIDLLKIMRSKNHLDGLVSDVLNFAKLGSGTIDYRIRDVSVGKTLTSVLEMVALQAVEKELRLEAPEVDPDLSVQADEDKLRQILLNLLANALKFTPPGGMIGVGVAVGEAHVTISVSDTGIGIPAEHLDRIFEPFMQSKQAIRTSDQGVGLGLPISRQLARAMRGELSVESVPGAGSTFHVRLPRAV